MTNLLRKRLHVFDCWAPLGALAECLPSMLLGFELPDFLDPFQSPSLNDTLFRDGFQVSYRVPNKCIWVGPFLPSLSKTSKNIKMPIFGSQKLTNNISSASNKLTSGSSDTRFGQEQYDFSKSRNEPEVMYVCSGERVAVEPCGLARCIIHRIS